MNKKARFGASLVLSLFFILLLGCSVSAVPSKVTGLKTSTSKATIKLSWNPVSDAAYYEIYSVKKSSGKETFMKKTTKTSISAKNCTYNKTYYFKVRAVDASGSAGSFSSTVSAKPKTSVPNTPKYFRMLYRGDQTVTFKWQTMSGIKGYIIELYDTETKSYVTKKTISNADSKTATLHNLTPGKTYKYRIRSYKIVSGQIITSKASDPVKVTAIEMSDDCKEIRSPYYVVRTKSATTCTSRNGKQTYALKANTKLYVTSKYGTYVRGYLKNGTPIKIKRSVLKYKGLDCSTKNDYASSTKEEFVNLKGLLSTTNYLIWVSQSKLRINVFRGSQGNWHLVKTFDCCIGKWQTRTASGVRKILKTEAYGAHGGPVLYFSSGEGTPDYPEGCAFHNQIDSNMSKAVSNGCVRMKLNDLYWLYNNCSVGTTVYVY